MNKRPSTKGICCIGASDHQQPPISGDLVRVMQTSWQTAPSIERLLPVVHNPLDPYPTFCVCEWAILIILAVKPQMIEAVSAQPCDRMLRDLRQESCSPLIPGVPTGILGVRFRGWEETRLEGNGRADEISAKNINIPMRRSSW